MEGCGGDDRGDDEGDEDAEHRTARGVDSTNGRWEDEEGEGKMK